MNDVLLIEKTKSRIDYNQYFNFPYDRQALTTSTKKNLTLADVELDLNIVDNYKYVILIGADAVKIFCRGHSITSHQGYLLKDKFLPLVNPAMLDLKPAVKPEFDKAVSEITKYITGNNKPYKEIDSLLIETEKEALLWIDYALLHKSPYVAVDTENTSLYPRDGYCLGISLAVEVGRGVYIVSSCITEAVETALQELFDTKECVFHNMKYDKQIIEYHFNITFNGLTHDNMLLHFNLDENNSHGLKELAIRYTEYGDYDAELEIFKDKYCKSHRIKKEDFTYDLIPIDIIYKYAAADAAVTLELFLKFYSALEKNPNLRKVYYDLLLPGSDALQSIEDNGIPFNIEELRRAQKSLEDYIFDLYTQLYTYDEIRAFEKNSGSVFNPASNQQVAQVLFSEEYLGLNHPGKKTDGGALSVDDEVLTTVENDHPISGILSKIRKTNKIKNSYIDKIIPSLNRDGRLRTKFNLHITTSGRLSSSGKLNAQTMPRKGIKEGQYDINVKRCIQANIGNKIVSADLSTAEMWVAAALSGDKDLQKIFKDKSDYHGFMAVHKYGLKCHPDEVRTLYPDKRQDAKTISFEILYALNFDEPVLKKFKVLKSWLERTAKEAESNAYLYAPSGRKRRVPNVRSTNKKESQHAIRSAVNFIFQSLSSDINLMATIDMVKWIKINGYSNDMKIFMLVHDSIIAEVREDLIPIYTAKLKEFVQTPRFGVYIEGAPIGMDIEIGDTYAFGK